MSVLKRKEVLRRMFWYSSTRKLVHDSVLSLKLVKLPATSELVTSDSIVHKANLGSQMFEGL